VDQFDPDIRFSEEISSLQAFHVFATLAEMSVELEWCTLQFSTFSLTTFNILRRIYSVVKAETHQHNSILSKYQDLTEAIQKFLRPLKIAIASFTIAIAAPSVSALNAPMANLRALPAILMALLVPQMCKKFRSKVLLRAESIVGSGIVRGEGDVTDEVNQWANRLQRRMNDLKEAEMELGIWRRRFAVNQISLDWMYRLTR
jgi:hypothetical protein